MNLTFEAVPMNSAFAVCAKSKPLLTPGRNPLCLPTQALAEAIAGEWGAHGKFVAGNMPLTALAYTAIDRIAGQEENIVEVLLAYVDTDTLSYRSSSSEKLAKTQQEQWDPYTGWMSTRFGGIWQITTGVMPLEQPAAIHQAIGKYLAGQGAMRLSAACVLASLFSSLVLAVAVLEKRLEADEAFRLSRLEEEAQAEAWGRDGEAERRAQRMQAECVAAGRFLRLLGPLKMA